MIVSILMLVIGVCQTKVLNSIDGMKRIKWFDLIFFPQNSRRKQKAKTIAKRTAQQVLNKFMAKMK